jgi:hypothetical protein
MDWEEVNEINTIDQNPIIILIGKYSVGCVPMVLGIDSVVYNWPCVPMEAVVNPTTLWSRRRERIDEMDRWYEYEY